MNISHKRQSDIRDALKTLFVLSEYISMCSLSPSNKQRSQSFRLSNKGFLCSILIHIFYLYCIKETYYIFESSKSVGMDIFAVIGSLLQIIIGAITLIILFLEKLLFLFWTSRSRMVQPILEYRTNAGLNKYL